MSAQPTLLIVDDDPAIRRLLTALLGAAGYASLEAADRESALACIRDRAPALALVDVRLGAENGLELLSALKSQHPEMSVIMISGLGSVESAVEAMQRGADNFVVKPIERERLLAVVAKGLEAQALRQHSERLERLVDLAPLSGPAQPVMAETLKLVDAVAGRDTTVLLAGETGSGKGLLARSLHDLSTRRGRPFVALNCAGLQRELTESELFGHERGAFTGAIERKLGLIEAADGGTLFLDEIGEMDLSIQPKLLKVIEERSFRRVGGLADITANVRIVAATHRDLQTEVDAGRFRADLYYRLNVFSIRVPPLRERRGEIPPLAADFLRKLRGAGAPARRISREAEALLVNYGWPGNVRELRNVIERAEILCPPDAEIGPAHLPPLPVAPAVSVPAPVAAASLADDKNGAPATIAESERRQTLAAMQEHAGNLSAAARALGISRSTLYRKLRSYGVAVAPPVEDSTQN